MKPAEVLKIQLKELGSAYRKLRKRFKEKDVHDFRLKIKRLRAFVILFAYDKRNPSKIPNKLKVLYDCAGAIRNLQLQRKRILLTWGNTGEIRDGSYLKLLSAEEEQWRRKALQLNSPLKKLRKNLRVPGSIPDKAVRKFIHAKTARLWTLLRANDIGDKDLHLLRKILKVILYNWHYAGIYTGQNLPACWQHKKDVRLFTEVLGAFHDVCMALQFLNTKMTEITDVEEVEALRKIEA
ncbi:MAG TPA: CHAD domain-containing protein, partial [Flavisolibacter sp.]|nr:CHAD domain-containing protein [Flavisolibacter sp.]